jgi:hypothetical protein
MRIFVSSSFQALQEYRVAAIRVLRQLSHEVVDKSALNAQLAQSYVTELMDRARLA